MKLRAVCKPINFVFQEYHHGHNAPSDKQTELVQLAHRLMADTPSGDYSRTELEQKLSKINARWQYLEGLVRARWEMFLSLRNEIYTEI